MKKILVVLLILAVAGGAFAQGFVFSGGAWGGVAVAIPNGDNEDPVFGAVNTENQTYRFRFNGRTSNTDNTAGINFRFQIANTETNAYSVSDGFGYGWFKTMDGLFTFYGGRIDEGPFETRGAISSSLGTNGGTGFKMHIDPIPGLTLGIGAFGNRRPIVFTSSDADKETPPPGLRIQDGKYNFGFNYVVPQLVRVQGNFTTTDGWSTAMYYDEKYNDMAAVFGVDLLALFPMGFNRVGIDAGLYGLGDVSRFGQLRIGQRITYAAAGLEGGIRFMQYIPLDNGDIKNAISGNDNDIDLAFSAFVGYAFGNWFPRLGVGFDMGSPLKGWNTALIQHGSGQDFRDGWDAINRGTLAGSDYMNFAIRPSVQYRFEGRESRRVEFGYTGQFDLSSDADKNNTNGRTQYHSVWIAMVVEF